MKKLRHSALFAIVFVSLTGCSGGGDPPPEEPCFFSLPISGMSHNAYVANDFSDDVTVYDISDSTGALARVSCGGGAGCNGDDFQAGTGPRSIAAAVPPPALSRKFVYVANFTSSDVSAYAVAATGALTRIPCGGGTGCNGDEFQAGTNATSVTVHPANKFVYVANYTSSDVSAYAINETTGALAPISCGGGAGCNGDRFQAGTNATSVTVHPSGNFLYVANDTSGDVSAYNVNAANGALARIPCGGGAGCNGDNFQMGGSASSVIVEGSGKFAYVASETNNDVSAHTIDATTGALTRIPCGGGAGCNGDNFQAGRGPRSLYAWGKFLYVANYASGDVSAYSVDATTGMLARVVCGGGPGCNGNDFSMGGSASSVTTHSTFLTSPYAYVASEGNNDVTAYAINATTGALSPISCGGGAACNGDKFRAGTSPKSITTIFQQTLEAGPPQPCPEVPGWF